MKFLLNSFFLFFIFVIIYNNNFVESIKSCKVAVLLSGDFSDLGYNYMFNEGRVKAESILKMADFSIFYKNLDESQEVSRNAFEDAIKQGANLIFVVSSGQTEMAWEYATKTKDKDIYWVIKVANRPSPDDFPKVAVLDFNNDVLQYILGYFSGKMTKTGVVGFVSPADYNSNNANAFYIGAKNARSNITFLNVYTGSWLNPEVSYKASQMLIENKADYLGMSQDDMSVQHAIMDSGSLGLGVTGYPNSLIYGPNIGMSYVTNWTDVFVRFSNSVMTDTWVEKSYYRTSLAEGGSLTFDEYSIYVNQEVIDAVNEEIERLKNTSYTPFLCSPMYQDVGIPSLNNSGCIDPAKFSSYHQILKGDKLSKVTNFNIYTIPILFVDFPNSMKLGITIISAICIFSCIVSMILVIIFRRARIIKSASPIFCLLILFGCIIIFIGCIIFTQSPSDDNCRTRVWLLSIGYTVFLGSLLVKNWRIWLLFDNPKLKKRAITNWKLYPWVAGILLVDLLILGIWDGIGDIHSEQRVGIDSLSKYEYTNVCSSNDRGSIALYILLIYHGLVLITACFISFKIKVVDIEEFNESKPIATSVYIITFCLFIIIPLMVSNPTIQSQTTTIAVCAIVTTILSIALLFGRKFYLMATQGLALNQTFVTSTKSSSFSASLDKNKNNNGDDESDESEEKVKKRVFDQVPQESVLATFSTDTEDIEEQQTDIEKYEEQEEKEEKEIGQQQNENDDVQSNVSLVKAKRLSNQLNGETNIESDDV